MAGRGGRLARQGGLGVAALLAGTAVVLLVEIQLARSGGRLPDAELVLDRPGVGRRVVWLGDSTAAGVGASSAPEALPSQVEDGLGAVGSFVAINNRVSQSVPHLHTHVVPRNRKDGLKGFFWPRTKYGSPDEAEAVAAKLRAVL